MLTLRSSCYSNVESRNFFWDDDMFPVLVKSINSVKHLIISLRLWSLHCWDLGAYKWRDLGLWLTSLAEWEVYHDWSVADGDFLAFWWLPRVKCLKAPLPNLGEAFETDLDCPVRAVRKTLYGWELGRIAKWGFNLSWTNWKVRKAKSFMGVFPASKFDKVLRLAVGKLGCWTSHH